MDQYRSLKGIPSNKNTVSDYAHHLRRLSEIKNSPFAFDDTNTLNQFKTLNKWRQRAKNYESNIQDNEMKKQNKDLLERLCRISHDKRCKTQEKKVEIPQLHIRHREISNKRFSDRINEQNLILAKNLVEQSKNVKSRSQIKGEMREYLERRIRLRKVLSPEEIESFKRRSKSQGTKAQRSSSSPMVKRKV